MYQDWDLQCHGRERWIIRVWWKVLAPQGTYSKRVHLVPHPRSTVAAMIITVRPLTGLLTWHICFLLFCQTILTNLPLPFTCTMLSGCPGDWNEGWCQQQPPPQKTCNLMYFATATQNGLCLLLLLFKGQLSPSFLYLTTSLWKHGGSAQGKATLGGWVSVQKAMSQL